MTVHHDDYEDTQGDKQYSEQMVRQQMAEEEAEELMAKAIDPYAAERLVNDHEFLFESLTAITVWLAYLKINKNNQAAVADAVRGLLEIFKEEAMLITSYPDREIEEEDIYEDYR
jgi:hypothetical protein